MKTRRNSVIQNQSPQAPKSLLLRQRSKQILQGSLPSKKVKKCSFQKVQSPPLSNFYDEIPFLPEIHLSPEQMKHDPLQILGRLQQKYAQFGGIKIIPPENWNPPFLLKHSKIGLTTRIQPLQNLKFGKAFQEKKQGYTLESFQQMAEQFQRRYSFKFIPEGKSQNSKLQNEYWQLVKGPSEAEQQKNPKKYKITVQYAADLPVNKYGSAFCRHESKLEPSQFSYSKSCWNLNNLYRSDYSLLGISDKNQEHIGGITIPWMYIGMQFASFCWHVEDCQINSLNYNHFGGDKIWYFLPHSQKHKFDALVQRKFGRKNVISKITYMIDPRQIAAEGIKIYKTYQRPRDYVCTFFSAYHCGFSTGFNVAEAVNYVVAESLPLIKDKFCVKSAPLFCYQWLIAQNYHSGLRKEVEQEYNRLLKSQLQFLNQSFANATIKELEIVPPKVKYERFSCHQCKRYVYLSFLRCECQKVSCYLHINYCCSNPVYTIMARTFGNQRKRAETFIRQKIK